MYAIAALLSVAVFSTTAPTASGAPQMIVHTDDLNLQSARGAAELRRRTDEAVLAMASNETAVNGSALERPELSAARARARRQADRVIQLANQSAGTAG